MFAERDKHYPSRSGQGSLATAITNIIKPVTKNNFGPSNVLASQCLVLAILVGETEVFFPNPADNSVLWQIQFRSRLRNSHGWAQETDHS